MYIPTSSEKELLLFFRQKNSVTKKDFFSRFKQNFALQKALEGCIVKEFLEQNQDEYKITELGKKMI